MTDSEGKLIWRGRYDTWDGLIRERHPKNTAGTHQPFRLQNQYFDEETGLHYNFLRYYDPITGRFMTQDPIGLAGGENFYRFAPNVQAWVDPLGLEPMDIGSSLNYKLPVMKETSYSILNRTLSEMKQLNVVGADQFFHCLAFCRVSKSSAFDKKDALKWGVWKERKDKLYNMFGLYGDGRLSSEKMEEDSNNDLKANEHGFKCGENETCGNRCQHFLDPFPKSKALLKEKGYF